jgi:hypothetical protein
MHSNVMLRFKVQALQEPPLCRSTFLNANFKLQEACMACKLLQKRFGIKNVSIDQDILKIVHIFPEYMKKRF